jgi:hypothetical protein
MTVAGSVGPVFARDVFGERPFSALAVISRATRADFARSVPDDPSCPADARLSEPGRIAKQMLENLGGLWGVHLLADVETLEILNKMAGGVRKRSNEYDTIEETFELRTASIKDWSDLMARRKQRRRLPEVELQDFTNKNVIRVGLETDCPHCQAKNWSSLTAVDYRVSCDRCLKSYEFPQARLREHSKNFYYRVVGPFSVPDYGRGSYASLLALRVINRFNMTMGELTFATA